MTVQDRTSLRAIILPAPGSNLDRLPTGRLLDDLGHQVMPASSPAHALSILQDERADLLIVDISNSIENKEFVDRLADLPMSQRPRELTIFSERVDESLASLRKRIKGSKVHIFFKPLHVHGLLSVLRQMDHAAPPPVVA